MRCIALIASNKPKTFNCHPGHHNESPARKIDLFQLASPWTTKQPGIARLRQLGKLNDEGRWACYSQVTTSPNNLGLSLGVQPPPHGVHLHKDATQFGAWARERRQNVSQRSIRERCS